MGQLKLGSTFVSTAVSEVSIMGAGVPVIIPSNGTVATNGTITLSTALPTVYSDAWVWLPAGAVVGGAAGLYYAEFSSTTVGQVFAIYANPANYDFAPYDPANVLHVNAVGSNSAYTQTTASDLTLMRETIPANLIGPTGQVVIKLLISTPSNANAKTPKVVFGSTTIHNSAITTSLCTNIDKDLTNRGKLTRQLGTPLTALGHGASATAAVYASEDTSSDVILTFTGQLAVATDYMVYEYVIVTVAAT
jgi:hypothetical protein